MEPRLVWAYLLIVLMIVVAVGLLTWRRRRARRSYDRFSKPRAD